MLSRSSDRIQAGTNSESTAETLPRWSQINDELPGYSEAEGQGGKVLRNAILEPLGDARRIMFFQLIRERVSGR